MIYARNAMIAKARSQRGDGSIIVESVVNNRRIHMDIPSLTQLGLDE